MPYPRAPVLPATERMRNERPDDADAADPALPLRARRTPVPESPHRLAPCGPEGRASHLQGVSRAHAATGERALAAGPEARRPRRNPGLEPRQAPGGVLRRPHGG